jgi:hypothetical protein
MHQDPLLDAHIRSQRYWNVDGLTDIATGTWVLLVALCLYGISHTQRGTPGRVVLVLVFAFGLPTVLLLSGRLIVAIRRRFTYQRTGFVEYRRLDRRAWIAGIALAAVLALLLVGLMRSGANWMTTLFVLQGVVPGACAIYFGRLVRLTRFQVYGLLYILAGIAVALVAPGLEEGMTAFWATMGAVHLLAGALTLWRYLRLHPTMAEAQ